ncbi:hypothetical protein Vadar_012554 [Vaccinium darrowii]|uniref:Uncharacterized protein n=1 Tax=Vaccinium darrowii TaxID=229202 RepID=A0ACB7YD86_9ERIC|nr:hypothetical protein Vadar_012554 [Vaccinium darrowii]
METLPFPPPPYMTDQPQFQEPPPPYMTDQQQYFQEPPPPYMPDQQQFQDSALPNPVAAATSNPWHTSGSIGPFFAVISVLSILAILSCLFARTFVGRDATPFESINHGGCSGWLKARWRRRIRGDCIGVGAKVTVGENGGDDGKVSDGV